MQLDPSKVVQRLVQRLLRRARPKARTLQEAQLTVRLPATHTQAAKSLVDLASFKNPKVLNRIDGPDTGGCHPDLIDFYKAFQKHLRQHGIPMIPTEFFRTPERQAELRAEGRSKAGPWQSPHQYGCALDLVGATRFWNLTRKEWEVIGTIGKEVARKRGLKMEWGGDWDFYDPAHWQLADWKGYKRLIDAGAMPQEEHGWRVLRQSLYPPKAV